MRANTSRNTLTLWRSTCRVTGRTGAAFQKTLEGTVTSLVRPWFRLGKCISQECKNGDIVVARINDEVTVKTFRNSGEGNVTLEPKNEDFKPIKVNPKKEEFYLEGICVGVIKRF